MQRAVWGLAAACGLAGAWGLAACSLVLPFAELSGGAGAGTDGGTDGGSEDAQADACPGAVSAIDGGAPGACGKVASGACQPKTPAPYPGWVPPTSPGTRPLCTAAQLDTLFADCISSATATASSCDGFEQVPANNVCANCVFTNATGESYGPVITMDFGTYSISLTNIAGCIVLFDPCQQACAAAAQSVFWCERSACQGCPDAPEEEACAGFSEGCSCSAVVAVYSQCKADLVASDSPAVACLNLDPQALARLTITKFCGGP